MIIASVVFMTGWLAAEPALEGARSFAIASSSRSASVGACLECAREAGNFSGIAKEAGIIFESRSLFSEGQSFDAFATMSLEALDDFSNEKEMIVERDPIKN